MEKIKSIKKRLSIINSERNQLLAELQKLEAEEIKSQYHLLGYKSFPKIPVTHEEKITLFTDLFCCRKDVFPKLWENKNKGTKGYSPTCKNEWKRTLCNKPRIKCSKCENREFIQIDNSIIKKHLQGHIVIGSYAINENDNCIFLAADFDKSPPGKMIYAPINKQQPKCQLM